MKFGVVDGASAHVADVGVAAPLVVDEASSRPVDMIPAAKATQAALLKNPFIPIALPCCLSPGWRPVLFNSRHPSDRRFRKRNATATFRVEGRSEERRVGK